MQVEGWQIGGGASLNFLPGGSRVFIFREVKPDWCCLHSDISAMEGCSRNPAGVWGGLGLRAYHGGTVNPSLRPMVARQIAPQGDFSRSHSAELA